MHGQELCSLVVITLTAAGEGMVVGMCVCVYVSECVCVCVRVCPAFLFWLLHATFSPHTQQTSDLFCLLQKVVFS